MRNFKYGLAAWLIVFGTQMSGLQGLEAAPPLIEGSPDSHVRVVIFEDLQCPDCADFRVMMDKKVLPKYRKTVRFEHHDFPLAKHVWAMRAAIEARYYAGKSPELALDFRRYMMAHIAEIKTGDLEANFSAKLRAFATKNHQSADEALAALADSNLAALVEADVQEGVARGVSKTPTVFVNGKPFIETFTFADFSKAIDEALKR